MTDLSQTTDQPVMVRPWLVLGLTALLVISMAFVGATFYQLMRNAGHERDWIALATDVQVNSQRLAKLAGESATGNLEAMTELSNIHQRMDSAMTRLRTGSSADGLPSVPPEVERQMSDLANTWSSMSEDTASITRLEPLIQSLAEASAEFLRLTPEIQANADRVVRQLTESGAPNSQVFAASRQLVLADRMLRRVTEILKGGSNAVKAAEDLTSEIALFEQVQDALANGNQRMGITPVRNQQALNSMAQVRSLFSEARPHLQAILDSSDDLFQVRGAADAIYLDSREMFNRADALSAAISRLPRTRGWPSQRTAWTGLVVMIALLVMLVGSSIISERRRAQVATSSNRHNQKAILRLLDELSSLADGDLSVQATVTDELTGAIADAVNYAIEQLREIVEGINETAHSVAESAQSTRRETSELAHAAREQAEQVGRTTEKIQNMATAFNSMAQRSTESSNAASDSVRIAHAGGEKVRETITGMHHIREQIQETAKRIKRLGESTQEIGDIVGLINGIAEQTNVLALNAAIQAASAGGAGRGFAVVADEVQQLAESATQATRRIESLVQTIQADTAGAVASMEETTTEVVNGTHLAKDAGQALVQIEEVSKNLSSLIEEISNDARTQSETATRVSELMGGIRDVSIKTSEGSGRTAAAVENLAELVLQLRESVADFKLPKDSQARGAARTDETEPQAGQG